MTIAMSIDADDADIRHVTKPSVNIFLKLGFAADEAERYQAELQTLIYLTRILNKQRVDELANETAIWIWMQKNKLKQQAVTDILHVAHSRVSDRIHRKMNKLSIDVLVNMLARISKPVKLVIN